MRHALKYFISACPSCKPRIRGGPWQLKDISSSTLFILRFLSASPHVRTVRTVGKGPSSSVGGPVNGTVVRTAEEKTAEYAVFALVPIFCVMGLLGILICNILKKKGYRCSADKEGGDEETATPQKEGKRKLGERIKPREALVGRIIAESSFYVLLLVRFAIKDAKLAKNASMQCG